MLGSEDELKFATGSTLPAALSNFTYALTKASANLYENAFLDSHLRNSGFAYHIPKMEVEVHLSFSESSGLLKALFSKEQRSSSSTIRFEMTAVPRSTIPRMPIRELKLVSPLMRGPDVRFVQIVLYEQLEHTEEFLKILQGLNSPFVDGVFGNSSKQALEIFQKQVVGMSEPSGVLDQETYKKLEPFLFSRHDRIEELPNEG